MQASDILYLIEIKSQRDQNFFLICETHFICQPLILAKLKPVSTIQALETKFEDHLLVWDNEKHFWCLKLVANIWSVDTNKPPTSGIDSFSLREMGDEMQITANARASMNDECGATARIGASSGLLSRPLTLIQWKPMQNSIARPIPRSGFLIILNSWKRNT